MSAPALQIFGRAGALAPVHCAACAVCRRVALVAAETEEDRKDLLEARGWALMTHPLATGEVWRCRKCW